MKNNEWMNICAACAEGTPPERCAYYGDPNGCNAPTLGKHPEGNLAERLQEVLEKAERRIAELERAPGNAAAMRAALKEQLRYWNSHIRTRDEEEMRKRTEAALAAPARNCDRYATAKDAYAAWMVSPQLTPICEWLLATAEGGAKCIDGLRGHPDCRGCDEHCLDVRKRNCFYWNPDIGKCALDGKPSCRIACDNFSPATEAAPTEGGAE